MDARTLAKSIAYLRAALGAGLVVAPARSARGWVGEDGTSRAAQVMGIAVGARDVAVAAGTLRALSRGEDARSWLAASVLCDAADAAANISRRDALPATGALGVTALAGGAALLGLWLLKELD
ncbi:hypothetical protein [Candidatus Solirubrobacter pratensis]|uniref:hypothetical protein n=1 Tax=Candidatus Solirubrobacter pratensis TaxID=1298857 RepID=UPI00040EB3E0|nr:hypothetical protein [Candidatus Solirubrobacter pratensis]